METLTEQRRREHEAARAARVGQSKSPQYASPNDFPLPENFPRSDATRRMHNAEDLAAPANDTFGRLQEMMKPAAPQPPSAVDRLHQAIGASHAAQAAHETHMGHLNQALADLKSRGLPTYHETRELPLNQAYSTMAHGPAHTPEQADAKLAAIIGRGPSFANPDLARRMTTQRGPEINPVGQAGRYLGSEPTEGPHPDLTFNKWKYRRDIASAGPAPGGNEQDAESEGVRRMNEADAEQRGGKSAMAYNLKKAGVAADQRTGLEPKERYANAMTAARNKRIGAPPTTPGGERGPTAREAALSKMMEKRNTLPGELTPDEIARGFIQQDQPGAAAHNSKVLLAEKEAKANAAAASALAANRLDEAKMAGMSAAERQREAMRAEHYAKIESAERANGATPEEAAAIANASAEAAGFGAAPRGARVPQNGGPPEPASTNELFPRIVSPEGKKTASELDAAEPSEMQPLLEPHLRAGWRMLEAGNVPGALRYMVEQGISPNHLRAYSGFRPLLAGEGGRGLQGAGYLEMGRDKREFLQHTANRIADLMQGKKNPLGSERPTKAQVAAHQAKKQLLKILGSGMF